MTDKKVSAEEMVEWWHEFEGAFPWQEDDKKYVQAVYDLIESADKGPQVDGAFIRQLAGELSTYNFTDKHPCEVSALLTKRFMEHGIRIEEKP